MRIRVSVNVTLAGSEESMLFPDKIQSHRQTAVTRLDHDRSRAARFGRLSCLYASANRRRR